MQHTRWNWPLEKKNEQERGKRKRENGIKKGVKSLKTPLSMWKWPREKKRRGKGEKI